MEFLHNNPALFSQAINLSVSKTGLRPEIIEKDYYVTMLLSLLSKQIPHLVFKGGTSLSKCYKAINRFSEDIDLSMSSLLSQGQRRKVKESIVQTCNMLNLAILNLDKIRSRRDYNRYEIGYNPVQASDQPIQPTVIIETSYTTISFPVLNLDVHSYIGDIIADEAPEHLDRFNLAPFTMEVQGLDRTLADKIFAVCDYYLQDKPTGHSRHLYDIKKLLPLVPLDKNFKKLMQEVRTSRMVSPVCPSAQPNIDICELLKKIIEENTYRNDYETITERLLGEPLSYDNAIEALIIISESEIFPS